MSEVKTIECLPYFVGGQEEALYKFYWPQTSSNLDIKLHLNYEALSSLGNLNVCKTAFYETCREGELIVAVNTDEVFGMNLEEGDLIMVYPENYDFEIDSNGNLLISEIF